MSSSHKKCFNWFHSNFALCSLRKVVLPHPKTMQPLQKSTKNVQLQKGPQTEVFLKKRCLGTHLGPDHVQVNCTAKSEL